MKLKIIYRVGIKFGTVPPPATSQISPTLQGEKSHPLTIHAVCPTERPSWSST